MGYPGEVLGRRPRSWIALALVLAWPAQAFAAIPSGQTTVPQQQGALLALGSIYRVETTVSLSGLRITGGRFYPLGKIHEVTELGTAFAVAPTGVLVTEAHVASPFGTALADTAAPLALAQTGKFGSDQAAYDNWVEQNNALPVGVRIIKTQVWRATASGVAHPRALAAQIIRESVNTTQDLALIQLADHRIPALELDESETTGTPVAVLGYGVSATTIGLPTTTVPGINYGSLADTAVVRGETGALKAVNGQTLVQVDAAITRGDSGGPAVDSGGSVHGIVRFLDNGTSGLMDSSSEIVQLLKSVGISNPPQGSIWTSFQTGMQDLWSNNLTAAQTNLADTVKADPTHPLAVRELKLVTKDLAAPARPAATHRLRLLFFLLASIALFAAVLCVVRLRRIRRTNGGSTGSTPQLPTAH